MALTDDLSERECHFDSVTNNPVNEPYWSDMFKTFPYCVWGNYSADAFAVSLHLVDDCFNGIRDSYTGLLIKSSRECFEGFCRSYGLIPELKMDENAYYVKKDIDNFYTHNGKILKRSYNPYEQL